MSEGTFRGRWRGLRVRIREWWGRLADDDLGRAGRRAGQLISVLQQRYGYTREQAEQEFGRRLKLARARQHRTAIVPRQAESPVPGALAIGSYSHCEPKGSIRGL